MFLIRFLLVIIDFILVLGVFVEKITGLLQKYFKQGNILFFNHRLQRWKLKNKLYPTLPSKSPSKHELASKKSKSDWKCLYYSMQEVDKLLKANRVGLEKKSDKIKTNPHNKMIMEWMDIIYLN